MEGSSDGHFHAGCGHGASLVAVIATTSQEAPAELRLKFAGALVEQLGAQLYPSATATIAELISNSWDADARNVWITIPLGEAWGPDKEIVVVDDGSGMTRQQAQERYLVVGRKRREDSGVKSDGGRLVHGRKGIGKLAAFGTAGVLELLTVRDRDRTSFRLDYDEIRQQPPGSDSDVLPSTDTADLTDKDGANLEHGTRVRLTRLRLKRAMPQAQFLRSMSRRFALDDRQMRVFINGEALEKFDLDLEFRFPKDGSPTEARIDDEGWAVEQIESSAGPRDVRWWIGFTESPLEDETQQGISVIANGKMAQRPFLFDRASGTEGQLGQEYLVGEVKADWLDEGTGIETDLIQSNRDQLQLEDERLKPLVDWGRKRLAWALRERNDLKKAQNLKGVEVSDNVRDLMGGLTKREQERYMAVAKTVSRIPEIRPDGVENLMVEILNAKEDAAVRGMIEEIETQGDDVQVRMWDLVRQFSLVDARRTLTLVEARLATIEKLQKSIDEGAREIPEIHDIIKDDTWLIDPRWDLYADEITLDKLGIKYEPAEGEEGRKMDFLFVLVPASPARTDEAIVVEIKRGSNVDGTLRAATEDEVNKFHGYVRTAVKYYSRNTEPTRVRGLMIANRYTERAEEVRDTLEQASSPKLEFKTWDRVIQDTRRLHEGWLRVSQRRIKERRESQ